MSDNPDLTVRGDPSACRSSQGGGMVGDALKDAAGEATEAVTDFVGDAANAIGDAAGDLGDALTFWD